MAAGLCAMVVHTALDGQHVPRGVSLEVSLPWPRVAQRHWPAHPLCGCSGAQDDNDPVTDLPRKAVTRTAKLASLPLGFAGRTALGLGKRVGGKPAEMVAAEMQARTAEQLFKVLGELKGGAMKFGQAMSIFEAALPEELAGPYRATLTKLQDAAPPMPAATVHQVLADELGPQLAAPVPSLRRHARPRRRRSARCTGRSGATAATSRSRSSTPAPARR